MSYTIDQVLKAQILKVVQDLQPISSLFSAFFVAEQQRLASVFDDLAQLDAEIRNCCAERDASARQLIALAGTDREAARPDSVAIPFARRAAS